MRTIKLLSLCIISFLPLTMFSQRATPTSNSGCTGCFVDYTLDGYTPNTSDSYSVTYSSHLQDQGHYYQDGVLTFRFYMKGCYELNSAGIPQGTDVWADITVKKKMVPVLIIVAGM